MNQKHSQNIFHANVKMNLMVENIIQNKNGIMISVFMNVEKQENTGYSKMIISGILAYVLAKVRSIMIIVNN